MTIILSNCKGYSSKVASIKHDILENKVPDVLVLNETLLRGERKIKMNNYVAFCKNRAVTGDGKEGGKGGGVATLVASHLRHSLTKVAEGRQGDEYIVTRLGHVRPAINIVNFYGENESRAGEAKVRETWERLVDDLEEIKSRGEASMVIGDMNRAVGSGELGIMGNKEQVSPGGKLIREELLESGEYVLVNGLAGRGGGVEVVGGPWTWCQPGREEEVKSCLDLVIVSASLLPFITRLVIDSSREFTPRRVMRRRDGVTSVYSDHYSLEVVLEGLPGREGRVAEPATWNLGKPGAWERYEELTAEAANKIEKVLDVEDLDAEEVMEKVERIEEKVRFKAFGKTKAKTGKKLAVRRSKTDEELLKEQARVLEDEILKVKEDTKGRVGRVFAMKKKVGGGKKEAQEPVAIRDPDSNELVVSAEEIKQVTLEYCKKNLTKKEEQEHREKEKEVQEEVHRIRMEEVGDDEFDVDKEEFDKVIKKFRSKQTKAYDFLVKASDEYKSAIFRMCKRFMIREEFPKRMQKTTLHMIWKRKGQQEVMKNNRFIHMKDYLARTCEAMVVGMIKEKMFEQSTVFQIGGQAGHFIEEHLFSIKSLIGLMEEQGRGVILTLVDIIAFFDRENILDVMDTMDSMGVNRKAARLWYLLNEKTEIRVKTAVGLTDSAEVGALVGQGSSGAAVASQAMIDEGLRQHFAGSGDEAYYGRVRFETAAFQDDISKPSFDVVSAQAGMSRLAAMLADRGLEAHSSKTGYLVIGTKKYKEEMEEELELMPLKFGDFEVVRKESDLYLGQVLHQDGLARSIEATIKERMAKVKGGIYTTASLLDTIQLQAMGGMMAAKYLWEGAIVPSLLSGAGTWVGITPRLEAMCEELQELFWRTVLQVPKGTPKIMLTAETKSRKMKIRIWKQKVMLVMRIRKQERSLAKAIHEEQVEMGWPGLAKEVAEVCKKLGVKDANKEELDKDELEDAVFVYEYKEMKEEMRKYEKLKDVVNGDFRKEQLYMEEKALDNARMAFRIRTKMVKNVKTNFKNMYKDNLMCEECDANAEETQEHMLECPGWKEEMGTLDATNMKDKVEFFLRVMKRKLS